MQWVKRPAVVAAVVAAPHRIRTIVVREVTVVQAPRKRMLKNVQGHQTLTTPERVQALVWEPPAALQVARTLLISRKIKINPEAALELEQVLVRELHRVLVMEPEQDLALLVVAQDLRVTEQELVRVQQDRELVAAKETLL